MTDETAAKKQPLERILEDVKLTTDVEIPKSLNADNDALMRNIALYYLTKYDDERGTIRSLDSLKAFMCQPIPKLYKGLFRIWAENGPPGSDQVSVEMAGCLEGGKVEQRRYVLARYLRNALLFLYKKKS